MALMEEELPREGRAGSGMPETSESQSLWRNPLFLALLGVFAVAWAVWAWVGSRHRYPNVFPDELLYGKLSQNLAAGNGLEWRGTSGGLPPLWPALLSLGWHFGSTPEAWQLLKVVCAGLASSVVFPVWFIGRTLVGDRRALVAAAFSVVGAWMAVTPFILSENLAYPLATAALLCLLMALRNVSVRWFLAGLAFAAVACVTRTQMLVLPVIFVLALALDVARQAAGERRARFDAWPRALWIVLGSGVALLLLAFIVKPGLTNYDVLATHASVGKIVSTAARHAAVATVAVAFVPVMALFALMLDRANWRDDTVGPLLVTTTAAAIVLIAVLARFEAWATAGHPVERYTMYIAPLLALVLVVAPGRVTPGRTAIGGVLMLVVLRVMPLDYNPIEEPSLYGSLHRLNSIGGFVADHLKFGVTLVAAIVAIAAGFALNARKRPMAGLAVAFALVAAVMLVQSWTYHHALVADEGKVRPLIAPHTLDWVDRAANGPVAIFAINKQEPLHQNADNYTDFFNHKITALYSNEPVGAHECLVALQGDGAFTRTQGHCPAWPRNFVIAEAGTRATFKNERVLATTPQNGRLVEVPPGGPKLLAAVRPPCTPSGCTGALQMGLHLDQSSELAITFGGSADAHRVQTKDGIQNLPGGRNTTIKVDVDAGDQTVAIPVDWTTADGPSVRSVVLSSGGTTKRIY